MMGTKEEILDVAIRLFSSYGFHKTTMDMIAREANVAKGTLYWYFSSKKDLFLGILEHDLDTFYTYLKEVKDDLHMTSREKLEVIIENRFDFFQRQQSVVQEVMNHNDEIDMDFACQMDELRNRHLRLLADIFTEGIVKGEFAIEDPTIAAIAFMGMNMAITGFGDLVPEEDREMTNRVLKQMVLRGVCVSNCS